MIDHGKRDAKVVGTGKELRRDGVLKKTTLDHLQYSTIVNSKGSFELHKVELISYYQSVVIKMLFLLK